MMNLVTVLFCAIFSFSSAAFSIEGAPRQTVSVPFEIVKMDQAFVGGIEVGVRSIDAGSQYIVKFIVEGFSLAIEAVNAAGIFEQANEMSYYSPDWHDSADSLNPSFVWWESDELTSSHVLKFNAVEQVGLPHFLEVRYTNESGEKSLLQIKVD